MTTITRAMIDYDGRADVFGRYTIEAVTITTEDGKRYRVTLESDLDSSPFEADCYSDTDIDAWREDRWSYVGAIVTPLDVPESVQFELSDSLWGLEFDFPLDEPQTHDGCTFYNINAEYRFLVYPVPDMIDEVKHGVERWTAERAKTA